MTDSLTNVQRAERAIRMGCRNSHFRNYPHTLVEFVELMLKNEDKTVAAKLIEQAEQAALEIIEVYHK